MTINFECGHCGKQLSTSDDKAGKTGKCPDCGEPVTVPQPEYQFEEGNPLDFQTPAAASRQAAWGGLTQTCPMCGAQAPAAASNCPECGEQLRESGRVRRSEDRFSTGNKLDLGRVFSTAWNRFTQRPGVAIGGFTLTVLVTFVVLILAVIAYEFIREMLRMSFGLRTLARIAVNLIFWAAIVWLLLGQIWFSIALCRGRRADFSLLFSGTRFLLRAVFCTLLIAVILFVAAIGLSVGINAARSLGGPISLTVARIVTFAVIVRVFMSFLWTFHVLVDTDATDVSAVFLSRDLMAGNYLRVALILFMACFILIAPLWLLAYHHWIIPNRASLTAILAMILFDTLFVCPLTTLILAVTYDQLSGGRNRSPEDAD